MMRSLFLPFFLLPASALQIPSIFADFSETQSLANDTAVSIHALLKRDGNCPVNFNSCSTLAAADGGACCTAGSLCTLDNAGNIACCPSGAFCTGTVTTGTGATTVLGAATTSTGTTTTTGTTGTTTTTAALTVVTNAYFPFPVIPTTYLNSAACNSAYSACQTNYAACTNDLQGNTFGVTIVAPNGGGVTVSPTATNLGITSATSICSSLSSQACYNIQSTDCARFTGTSTTGQFSNPTGTANAARAGVTLAPGLAAAVVGWGILERMV